MFIEIKRKLLDDIGIKVGEGTVIVGPILCTGNLMIGKNLLINGNGTVLIGDNCDIAPEVTFNTGGHKIGNCNRRAGEGENYTQIVGNGVLIGGRSTIFNNTIIGNSSVIAGCSCVVKDVPENSLVGGTGPCH